MYGVDVAKKRADDLDRKILTTVSDGSHPAVLELGCGSGAQSRRLVAAGAVVTAVDIAAYDADWKEGLSVRFHQADIRILPEILKGNVYELCLLQRTIHYLRYDEARALLKYLKSVVRSGLYISVTGLESDIGVHYADASKSVADRFGTLSFEDAEKFSITEPMCLYTPEEFIELLQSAGWKVEECWVSAFGNVKVVCK